MTARFAYGTLLVAALLATSTGSAAAAVAPGKQLTVYLAKHQPWVSVYATRIQVSGGHVAVIGGQTAVRGVAVHVDTRLPASGSVATGVRICRAIWSSVRALKMAPMFDEVVVWARDGSVVADSFKHNVSTRGFCG